MGWNSTRSSCSDLFRVIVATSVLVAGCGAGDNRLDPGDLELRDLLGVSPDAAAGWDPEQRAAARRVLEGGLAEHAEPALIPLATGTSRTGPGARA